MHIVLVEPEIHWNTGNIGRTCVATETTLHLVGKLGFSLDAAEIRRSGLDYWPKLELVRHESFDDFLAALPAHASLLFFSARAKAPFWDAPYEPESYLVFGRESTGLPETVLKRFADKLYQIPIGPGVRSLNLSTAAAVALYEGLRRTGLHPAGEGFA
ncbi:MAG: tRNA (cytidine(34)-2'-O)-methyltransferase [Elusimicrobia bacterium]|nr:tRNA (cytidine(34)-2'-O)-methyltransferase [Elusimicrobiota bacterium]MDE2312550.1 tRNA (cytidine(34)-2'-O)-methyltransferase [Elusimicrobiota bacterium]